MSSPLLLDAEGTPISSGDEVAVIYDHAVVRSTLLRVSSPRKGSRYSVVHRFPDGAIAAVMEDRRATQVKMDGGEKARTTSAYFRPCQVVTASFEGPEGKALKVRLFLDDRNPSVLRLGPRDPSLP